MHACGAVQDTFLQFFEHPIPSEFVTLNYGLHWLRLEQLPYLI